MNDTSGMNRVKVKFGEYKIGDVIDEKKITGFGKPWKEFNSKTFLYENEVQYAYFEEMTVDHMPIKEIEKATNEQIKDGLNSNLTHVRVNFILHAEFISMDDIQDFLNRKHISDDEMEALTTRDFHNCIIVFHGEKPNRKNGRYVGKIVSESPLHVVQSVSHNKMIVHAKKHVRANVGEVAVIKYNGRGAAIVEIEDDISEFESMFINNMSDLTEIKPDHFDESERIGSFNYVNSTVSIKKHESIIMMKWFDQASKKHFFFVSKN